VNSTQSNSLFAAPRTTRRLAFSWLHPSDRFHARHTRAKKPERNGIWVLCIGTPGRAKTNASISTLAASPNRGSSLTSTSRGKDWRPSWAKSAIVDYESGFSFCRYRVEQNYFSAAQRILAPPTCLELSAEF
jgi:hypothetical protein